MFCCHAEESVLLYPEGAFCPWLGQAAAGVKVSECQWESPWWALPSLQLGHGPVTAGLQTGR